MNSTALTPNFENHEQLIEHARQVYEQIKPPDITPEQKLSPAQKERLAILRAALDLQNRLVKSKVPSHMRKTASANVTIFRRKGLLPITIPKQYPESKEARKKYYLDLLDLIENKFRKYWKPADSILSKDKIEELGLKSIDKMATKESMSNPRGYLFTVLKGAILNEIKERKKIGDLPSHHGELTDYNQPETTTANEYEDLMPNIFNTLKKRKVENRNMLIWTLLKLHKLPVGTIGNYFGVKRTTIIRIVRPIQQTLERELNHED